MAYDQSQGKMIPSPKARRERLSAELDTAEKAKTEAKKKGDEDWKKEVLQEFVTEAPARSGTTKDGSMFQSETPSGGYVSARSGSKNGIDVSTNMQASIDRDRDKESRLADMRAQGRDIRDRLVTDRLNAAGYDWKSAESANLYKDGKLDFDKAKRAADLAQGQKAQETFAAWDADKRLGREAVRIERDARRELSNLRSARVSRYGGVGRREGRALSEAEMSRMRELENMIETGEQNRDGLNPGFWRTEAEDQERNRMAQVESSRRTAERSQALAESQQKQAAAVRTRTEAVGRPLTEDEIKKLGYPSWDDEAAWQERMKTDPSAYEVYKMRPVNVSRAGKAMSRALSSVV